MSTEEVLKMTDISKHFGGTKALDGIHFSLKKGEIHALLGENGAGKSTLIKVLGGIHQPDRGEIFINGEQEIIDGINKARELGIGVIHQEIVLVPHLSIVDNLFLGREISGQFGIKNQKEMRKKAQEMIAAIGLKMDVDKRVGELNIAQQQMLEIVKAISFNVKILVMDEPTSSLSEEEVQKLFEIIEILKQKDVSIIYISHRLDELFAISNRITVIRDGSYVGTKETKTTNSKELVSMMVGRNLESFYVKDDTKREEVVLAVSKLSKNGTFNNISFDVHKGEILGFSGLVGAGRSEIMDAIFGVTSFDSGQIKLNDKIVHFKNPEQAIDAGIAMVPEDRKKQGLVLIKSVGFNMTLASIEHYKKGVLISERKRLAVIQDYINKLHVKTASIETEVGSLSGGNQQKVVIGKWLATQPQLLILDEPTRGVDVAARQEIYGVINELAKDGLAIIMISSDLPEIVNMCDKVCVVREGNLVEKLTKDEITQENIMRYATGG
ncbi:sugar ABC transporter ATP-binding protein [Enterococcus dispar]|uniref:sugar ABC transporter ATP-binding protein n=1 Tax=Enterococcus dispar TaxID=44009 RepID=UPI00232E6896|nr:sugar ABC transporter ATP-binding protein [Enterococcus dispar]WCG32141.1 sugar ABC transporter ATP-binding protein [Enterococcus dispar]